MFNQTGSVLCQACRGVMRIAQVDGGALQTIVTFECRRCERSRFLTLPQHRSAERIGL